MISETVFELREVPAPELSIEKIFPSVIHMTALFNPDTKWRLVEEFGPYCFDETENGKLLFSDNYSDMESLISWLLTFKDKVKVLEPETVRDELLSIAQNIIKVYKEDEHAETKK